MNALTANPAEGTENGILALLQSKDFAEKVGSVLPKHITTERMIRMMFLAMRKTPKLLKCTPASIQEAMMVASSYGIEPDGRRAHLIPYEQRMKVRGQWTSVLICQLQLDYKGIAELVMRSGLVSHISADVVREGDLFKFSKGRLEEHIPWFIRRDRDRPENAGIRYAAYSLVVMKDGTERVEVMSNTDILSIRDRSQGWKAFKSGAVKQSPWNPEEEVIESEMWKKTTFKRLSKWLPLSAEIRDLLEREDSLEFPDSHSGVVNASNFSNITAGLSELVAKLENEPTEDTSGDYTDGGGETTKDESASTATVTKPVATSKRASAKKPEVSEEFAIWRAEIDGCEDAIIAANIRAEIDVGNDKLTDPEKDQLIALIDAKFPPKE